MALFIRFTETEPNKNEISYNGFTGEKLKGICCFEINENDSIYVQVRKIADVYSNYVKNSNGICYLFEGNKLEENFNNEGVIAEHESTVEKMELYLSEYGYSIK